MGTVAPIRSVSSSGDPQKKLDPRPGLLGGWWPVLRHPAALRKFLPGLARSGICWLHGHQVCNVLHQELGVVSVECRRCGMRIMARPILNLEGLQDRQKELGQVEDL